MIKAVDGTAVEEPGDVAELVTKHQPGENVTFTIIPAKEAAAAEKAGRAPEGSRKITITTEKAPPRRRAARSGRSSGSGPGPTTRSRSRSTSSSRTSAAPAPG